MKKFLISAAAVAALATSAMAFDVFPTNELAQYKEANLTDGQIASVNTDTQTGNALIYPLFFAGNGWKTQIRVINTTGTAVAAKVVLYSSKDSKELRDFNIYLSGNDEFLATIEADDSGNVYIKSTDDSAPLEGTSTDKYPFATADKPLSGSLSEGAGYIQVIGMAMFQDDSANALSFHGDHVALRKAYDKLSANFRGGKTSATDFTFQNGVVINQQAKLPFLDLDSNGSGAIDAADTNVTVEINGDDTKVYLKPVAAGALAGDVRVTNTINGTDLVLPAVALDYNSTTKSTGSLIYLEGEKANLADMDANKTDYNNTALVNALGTLSAKTVYMTYGDTQDVSRNYTLVTTPFKRMMVQEALKVNSGDTTKLSDGTVVNYDDNVSKIFPGIAYDSDNKVITSYGAFKLIASIYDAKENIVSAGQFSPATTPTIKMENEVSSTGTDKTDANKLPYYLQQAQDKGWTTGYVILENVNGNSGTLSLGQAIPGIVTQMMATEPKSGTVVTSWIRPAAK